jgi:predicted Fe-Mo cluster-binding NifX family protein
MKIAIVSDDGHTISAHLGRAEYYVVVQVEDGSITDRQLIRKGNFHAQRGEEHGCCGHDQNSHDHAGHSHANHEQHGLGEHSEDKHRSMFAPIADCQILIARGMGMGAQRGLQQVGIQPILTEIEGIDDALQAHLAGALENHPERVH